MIEGSDVGMNINSAAVPIFTGLQELVKPVLFPVVFTAIRISVFPKLKRQILPPWLLDVFFDPQTAGGLFFSLPQKQAQNLVEKCVAPGLATPLLSVKLLPIIPVKFLFTKEIQLAVPFTPEP